MKEYTLIAAFSVLLAVLADRFMGTSLLKRRLFYLFLAVLLGFKFRVNGYLTGSGVVLYNREFFLGVRIGSIPLEDFLFGFSMVVLSVVFWEFFKRASE